jgi:hypothetical protein
MHGSEVKRLTFFAALALAGAMTEPALATVAPRCRGVDMKAAPLPVGAGAPAVLLHTDPNATKFQIQWLDPQGSEILFDVSESGEFRHLRPRVALGPGVHALSYTDDCETPVRPPSEFSLDFEPAPPPPSTLGVLSVAYEAYCPDDGMGKVARDFPPPVTLGLVLAPALVPYAPLLWVTIGDDTGRLRSEYWASEALTGGFGHDLSVPLECGGLTGALPSGARSFVATGTLLDGPPLESATATAMLDCPYCPFDAGSTPGEGAETPPTLSVKRGDAGCSVVASSLGRRSSPEVVALLVAIVRMQLRRRSRKPR